MGEKLLWTAVLIRAFHDAAGIKVGGHSIVQAYLRRAAWDWIFSDNYEPGSFNWICDQVGLESELLRRRLLRERRFPREKDQRAAS